eukprot:m.82385 g.82385  ORF g.82385 m.82385 type:complete len:85 (+) comp8666_c0_seq7:167-421(+)
MDHIGIQFYSTQTISSSMFVSKSPCPNLHAHCGAFDRFYRFLDTNTVVIFELYIFLPIFFLTNSSRWFRILGLCTTFANKIIHT